MSEVSHTNHRTLTGRVISTKMQKTVNVCVERKREHPKYEKRVTRSTNLLAHDPDQQCHEGDLVVIQACRPLSRHKAWRVLEVLDRSSVQPDITE